MPHHPSPVPDLHASFELGSPLGAGGFGEVVRGRPRGGGPDRAVKLSLHDLDPGSEERVLREASLARGLRHPGLVHFEGLFRHRDGRLALVYELLPGKDLDQSPLGQGPASPKDLELRLGWLDAIAGALDFLHQAGLVHRDVKPGNVRLLPDRSVRLLDFGLLRASGPGGTVTATGLILGTPAFMAPELFQGEPATPASDGYALAALATWLVTGTPPLSGSPGEILAALREPGQHQLKASLRSRTGPLAAPLLAGLAEDPGTRPGSCRELVEALRAAGAPERRAAPSSRTTQLVPQEPSPGRASGLQEEPPTGPLPRALPQRPVDDRAPSREPPPPRRSPWLAPGLTVLLGLLLGWVLLPLPGSVPDGSSETGPAPPPVPAELDPLQELLPALEQEFLGLGELYLDADGERVPAAPDTREFLERDPEIWALARRHMPRLRDFYRLVDQGLTAEALSPSQRAVLGSLDRIFRDRRLPRPFRPFLEARPHPGTLVRDTGDFPGLDELHRSGFARIELSGWDARCLLLLEEIDALARGYGEEARNPPDGPRGATFREAHQHIRLLISGSSGMTPASRYLYLSPESRPLLYDWIEEGVERVRDLQYALRHALTETSLPEQALALCLTHDMQRVLHPFLLLSPGFEGFPEVRDLARQPILRVYVRGQFERRRQRLLEGVGLPSDDTDQLALLETCWASPPLSPSREPHLGELWSHGRVMQQLTDSYQDLALHEKLLQLFRRVRELGLDSEDPANLLTVRLREGLMNLPPEWGKRLTEEEVRSIRAGFQLDLDPPPPRPSNFSPEAWRDVLSLARRARTWDPRARSPVGSR